jgi:hypothetical protein
LAAFFLNINVKKIVFFLVVLVATTSCFAQNYQWAKAAGWIGQDAARAVAVDDDGNVYVAGQYGGYSQFDTIFCYGNGTYEAFLAKYNSVGDIQWVKHAGGPNEDYATGVCIDTEGFIYITGYFLDSIFFDELKLESADLNDVFIAKYTPEGELVWAKSAGGRGDDKSYTITADPHGNVAIAGQFSGTANFNSNFVSSSGDYDSFLAKYGNNGTCQWVKKGGGSNDDGAKGIASDAAGNFFITGYIYGNIVFDTVHLSTTSPTSTDIFIAKYTPWGSFEWIRKCDSYLGDNPYAIATDWQGYSYLTGYFQNETTFGTHTIQAEGYNDAFLAKYAPNGDCEWAKAIGGNDLDVGTSVCVDDFGSVYLTGFFDSAIYFVDTTYIAPGYEVFIAKYWWNGDELWTQIGGGGGNDFGNAIAVNNSGELVVAGYYNLYGYFGDYVLPLTQEQDIFVTKLSNTVGIKEETENSFAAIYPNPSQGDFSIEAPFEKNQPLTISVTDALGRIVFSSLELPKNNKIKLSLNALCSGIYFLNVYNSSQSFSGKIIRNK